MAGYSYTAANKNSGITWGTKRSQQRCPRIALLRNGQFGRVRCSSMKSRQNRLPVSQKYSANAGFCGMGWNHAMAGIVEQQFRQ